MLTTNLEQIIIILAGIPIMVVNNSNDFGEQLAGGFSPTHLKNMRTVKLDHLPRDRGENNKCLSCHRLVILDYHQPTSWSALGQLSEYAEMSHFCVEKTYLPKAQRRLKTETKHHEIHAILVTQYLKSTPTEQFQHIGSYC